MKIVSITMLVLVSIGAALGIMNLDMLMRTNEFDLGFTRVQVSVGVLLIAWITLTFLAFLAFAIYVQTTALLESRRQSREMEAMRTLTDKAEASRITELRAFMEAKFLEISNLTVTERSRLAEALNQSEKRQLAFAEQQGNTLAAYIGELEGLVKSRVIALGQ